MAATKEIKLSELASTIASLPVTTADIDTTDMWRQVGIVLEGMAKDCFDQSRSPEGVSWSPLRHPRPRGGTKPLLDTGLLRASLTSRGKGHLERVTPDGLEWGSNLIYATTHQYGAVITPKKGKFLTIPVSIEALRAGSPLNFPNAKERLGWIIGRGGGIVYEKPNKKKKKPTPKGAKKVKKRSGKFLKRLRRIFRKLMKSTEKIIKLSKRVQKYTEKLLRMKPGTAVYIDLLKKINSLTKIIRIEKAKKARAAKEKKVRSKSVAIVDGVEVVIHYYLTKQVIVPARPYLGFNDKSRDLISEVISEAIIKAIIRKAVK